MSKPQIFKRRVVVLNSPESRVRIVFVTFLCTFFCVVLYFVGTLRQADVRFVNVLINVQNNFFVFN